MTYPRLGLLVLVGLTLPSALRAQKTPKVDSLLIALPVPKAQAIDKVLEAFALIRLDVTDQAGSLITSNLGEETDMLLGSVRYRRTVRALVLPVGEDAAKVLITGEEVRSDPKRGDREFRRLRIDNKAKNNGEKAWCRMVAVAVHLDSTQVSEDARKREACAYALR